MSSDVSLCLHNARRMTAPCPRIAALQNTVKRRYRMPARPALLAAGTLWPDKREGDDAVPETLANRVAIAMDRVREAIASRTSPDDSVRDEFCHALALLIRRAADPERGDAAFRALVLRTQSAAVREYTSLAACAERDRRAIAAAINAIAHPQRQQRMPAGARRDAAQRLYRLHTEQAWERLFVQVSAMRHAEAANDDPALARSLQRLLEGGMLGRMQRLSILSADPDVRAYQALRQRQGPAAGSAFARTQGQRSRQRGEAVEQQAARAMRTLASRLQASSRGEAMYDVVTSLRAPGSLPLQADYAKSEWDVVLLRQSPCRDDAGAYEVCLLIEAKAAVEAASGDLPRLLRGLRLLGSARPDMIYRCMTDQGEIDIHGASLASLAAAAQDPRQRVLYCTDAPVEKKPTLLTSGSRMQLLSNPHSVAFATRLQRGEAPEPKDLEKVWDQLVTAPKWEGLRQQHYFLHLAREMMVHVDDLLAAACHTD